MAKETQAQKEKQITAPESDESEMSPSFPIVGVGASAGGLEAFTKLLENLPSDTGMGYVFIQHLASGQESMLTEILSRTTKMTVHKITNDMQVQPNNIYVIPPDSNMTIEDHTLKLAPKTAARIQKPVDAFLISLAGDLKSHAIGVILSGTGSDGTEGMKAIYAEGGITFAQEEESAKYPGMPHSAIAAGIINLVLTPEQISKELTSIGHHPYLNHEKLAQLSPEMIKEDSFRSILALLRLNFGVDFFAYKQNTLNRRITRRMIIHKMEKMEDYAYFLRNNKAELQAVYDDLLIGVTSFFREEETYTELSKNVFPKIIMEKSFEVPIRVWVPGCSTGEEVYSVAISLLEFLEKCKNNVAVQIFGTDISEKNIERARQGIYPESIKESVSAERLQRFFIRKEAGYQINKSVRDICIFAKQDLTHDPPFSSLDLISCRNVLIYLKPQAQKRIIPLFHYALKPNGFLALGRSESIGGYDSLFEAIDKGPIYLRKPASSRIAFNIEAFEPYMRKELPQKVFVEKPVTLLQRHVEKIISNRTPPAIVVNEKMEIISFHGNTAPYLAPAPGQASLDLMKMAKQELTLELQTAIFLARKKKTNVRRERIRFKLGDNFKEVNFEVFPVELQTTNETYFVILFEDVETASAKVRKTEKRTEAEVTARSVNDELRKELATSKENLQTIIEEQEATNEELRSALEEVQSSNEELQSTNEELETAKEELQSTNEELNTLNEELGRRNEELVRIKDDLNNVFNNIDIGVLVLSRDLKIRLFTPTAQKMFNLIPSDSGRPLSDIRLKLQIKNLEKKLLDVIENLTPIQEEVKDEQGMLYLMRIRPYLTAERKIDGVVMSLVNIDLDN